MDHETAQRIRQAIGRDMRPAKSVHGLEQLPADVLEDAEAIFKGCGGIYVFAYLYHVTDASFGDVKVFTSEMGWLRSVED